MKETGRQYNPEEEAHITAILRNADRSRDRDVWMNAVFNKIKPRFGIYFDKLERICRLHELSTHLLAVPEVNAAELEPELMIVDGNDNVTPRPFAAFCFPTGHADMLEAAKKWNIPYEPVKNEENLTESGIFIPRPGTSAAMIANARLS